MKEQKNRQPRKEQLLVNDVEKNLPPIRSDVEMIPITHEDKELIWFHDPQGYLPRPYVLDKQIAAFLPLLNGNYSIRDIIGEMKRYGSDIKEQQLLEFIRQLDDARLLLSPWFRHYKTEVEKQFEQARERKAVCAGQSYPSDPEALTEMLENAFSTNGTGKQTPDPASSEKARSDSRKQKSTKQQKENPQTGGSIKQNGTVKALFAPHIDPRVGLSAYIPGFRSLSGLTPSRVVLLATSHYAGMYYPLYENKPFIATRKDFETPLGVVQSDSGALDLLQKNAEITGCSFSDRAHRNEHSIELHLVFLQYLWSHPFRLVPILVGSLEEMYYMQDGETGKKVEAMAGLLRKQYGDDPDTLFLISGDLAHVGRKFGDQQPANTIFNEVKSYDKQFLDRAVRGDRKALLEWVGQDYDPYRICGFPPLYTALGALPGVKGELAGYELWDEREQESAVTFGSLVYRQDS